MQWDDEIILFSLIYSKIVFFHVGVPIYKFEQEIKSILLVAFGIWELFNLDTMTSASLQNRFDALLIKN